jgi:hypothetical protein
MPPLFEQEREKEIRTNVRFVDEYTTRYIQQMHNDMVQLCILFSNYIAYSFSPFYVFAFIEND